MDYPRSISLVHLFVQLFRLSTIPATSCPNIFQSFCLPLLGNHTPAVKNSGEFADFISSKTLQNGELLVSFDVVSLFTTIPTGLAARVARHRLMSDDDLQDRTQTSVWIV